MEQLSTHYTHKVLNHACQLQATDIHFYPNDEKETVSIFYRLNGQRQFIRVIHMKLYESILTYLKFSANMDIAETRKPQDGIFTTILQENRKYSFRLSTLPLSFIESLSIRIIPEETHYDLNHLMLFPFQVNQLKKSINSSGGMIVFSGPTGSGKSTLMYALIEYLIERELYQVITLEDPIERRLDTVLQVEINEKAGITYQAGLRAALRHDPDVLLIGEIRDGETAKYAIRAALTGHIVFTTVHAKNPLGTIRRFLEFGISKVELLQTLSAICTTDLLTITYQDMIRRATIVDLVDGYLLESAIEGEVLKNHRNTINHLKKKAYAYGFIETLETE